ncbi:uncharacterized protein LOC119617585 [Kryptolebias marmoratus]|uniref:uncharacterized protein LOC112451080 n=1 Tax=Kryptolebias marmoratus TaxID=37003 RepID=UPI000D52F8D9|nr:uncharacterized protein LOC112451080 [Kryptolebias marmoratus]XP_024865046.1 uncharacterized protein LOC108244579 [Kryptolebias marmoratus]XP_024866205.1 uncharacterized protein LOC112451367 [Kryptolebias marmoratus]XP_037834871.1 uncharacterized protein LOC119617585 [Kryptolebias marmoratus]
MDSRPKQRTSMPSYLSDYDLSGLGAQSKLRTAVPAALGVSAEPTTPERPTIRSPSPPLSQSFDMANLRDDEEQEQELSQSMDQATGEQRTHQVPEFNAALDEIRQENAELRKQFQSLMVALQPKPAAHQPLFPPPPPQGVYSGGGYGHYQLPTNTPAYEQLQYPTLSPQGNLPQDLGPHRVSQHYSGLSCNPYYAVTPQQRAPSYAGTDPSFLQTPCFNEPQRETTYRGPKPTIPSFTSPDPREFARMKIALENLLPADATERYKYQILTDHLRCEEASLVADSYCNSRQPYTDTMLALTKMYGQPHKLAVQRIAELMDGPNIRSGDVKGFRLFALNVRSLVGMLEQLGQRGQVELVCGSHVSRLVSKLPYDLNASFKRFIHPLRLAIPTLVDFADWLEYELEVQDDGMKPPKREELFNKKPDTKRTPKPPGKTATILLGTEKVLRSSSVAAPSAFEQPANKSKREDKVTAYCPYCDNDKHFLNNCSNFKNLTKEQKVTWIKTNNKCWRCGRNHQAAKCTLKAPCKTCGRRHLLVLHEVNERVEEGPAPEPPSVESCLVNTANKVRYVDRPVYNCKVLLKISKVLLRNGDKSLETYAVLDDGSERTILLQSAAKLLGLKGSKEVLDLRTVRQEVEKLHGAAVSFTISPAANPDKTYNIQNAFTAEQLSLAEHSHPVASLQQKYKHLSGLPLPPLNRVHPMLLIGADCTHLITPIEPVRLGPPGGPAAVKTLLGWTLQGPAQTIESITNVSHCLFTSTPSPAELFSCVEKLWQMDVLPYRSEKLAVRSRQDQEAVRLLQEQTVRVNVSGVERYATPLLRVKNMPPLKATPEAVLPLLRGIEKRLAKSPGQAAAYQREIEKLVEAGYVVKLGDHQLKTSVEAWYIPHHMVQHNGKNRVVFNCSFQYQGYNLNQLLLPGPTLGPALLPVLLRFREHAVAFSSDIRGMFHQVRLLPKDRPLLRFLWRDMKRDNPPDVYEWQVLPFGTTCSPCCATFALQKHVTDHSQPEDDVCVAINKSFYVDNCLQSLPCPVAAKALVDKLHHLLAGGGFELRQWASNNPNVIHHLPPDTKSTSCELWLNQDQSDIQEPALGLHWNCKSDTLTYKHRHIDCSVATMRNIYRVLASQYDPLGYIVPYTTRAKVIVRHLWEKRRDWDDPQLPEELLQKWYAWEAELAQLHKITLPRCYTSPGLDQPNCKRDIHVFCDASEQAYGSVAYLRTESPEGEVEVAFLAARSRVSPKKQQSIPRLELCAALTGAQLYKVISTELTLPIRSCIFWSDSATVLTWLGSDSCRYKVFVGTRVAEIQKLTEAATWRYVPSRDNPADDITRGLTIQDISTGSRWTDGPVFLKLAPSNWPDLPPPHQSEPEGELKRQVVCLSMSSSSVPDPHQYRTWDNFLEATAHQLYGAADPNHPLTADSYAAAELEALQQAQKESLLEEITQLKDGKPISKSSRLLLLAPEFDEKTGLIRVGGRLRRNPDLTVEEVHPVVLDPRHALTQLIIQDYDYKLQHPGPERVFAEIRRRYWVLRGREAVRRHQRSCVECKRWKGRPNPPRMADLPPARLRLFKPPFYSTGVDCFGPYIIKIRRSSEKRWGILFKCLTTRAVHLDLIPSMDTDAFLMALRRFIARRGKPKEILCDQGTNFRGGERELQESFQALHPDLKERLAYQQIRFAFNPPGSPHFGGCWEREIRSLKIALQVILGAQTVTEEVLHTVLIEIEGMLNSKPLGYTSSEVADPDPVTPNYLHMGRRDASLPQVVYDGPEILGRRRWRHSQNLADHFWHHFLKYYLPGLQARQKWQTE